MKTDLAPTKFVSRPRKRRAADAQAASVVGPGEDPRGPRPRVLPQRLGRGRRQPDPPRQRGDQRDAAQPVVAARARGPRGAPPDPLRHRRAQPRLLPVLASTSPGAGTTGSTSVNPWTRFRLGRLVNWTLILIVLTAFVAWRSETPFFETLVNLPSTDRRLHVRPDRRAALHLHDRAPARAHRRRVRRPVLVHGQGRGRDLLPRRRLGALRRRVGPRRRAREDEGEPRLRRGPRVDRATGRPRARWRSAVRASGNRQDAHGRSGRGRDGQALRVRRARRLPQHVLRRRRAQGALAVQEAEEVGAALRRRHRLLRRGRRARQPRRSVGRHRIAVHTDLSAPLQRHQLHVGRHEVVAAVRRAGRRTPTRAAAGSSACSCRGCAVAAAATSPRCRRCSRRCQGSPSHAVS